MIEYSKRPNTNASANVSANAPSTIFDADAFFKARARPWRLRSGRLHSWRHRPLIFCAVVTVCGAALGFQIAPALGEVLVPRALGLLLWILALNGVLWTNRFRAIGLPLATAFLFIASVVLSASRLVAPRDDISHWVDTASRSTSQKPMNVMLRGEIAAPPRVGDFGVEFSLLVHSAKSETQSAHRVLDVDVQSRAQSRVWARLPLPPFQTVLQAGDVVEMRAEMSDLPRAGNWGEREKRAYFVAENCWSLARVRKNDDWRVVKSVAAGSLSARLSHWRRAILQRYEQSFRALNAPYAKANAQLLTALVWGEGGLQQPLPRLTRERFRAAGMSHVLVASGTQVAFFAGILILLSRALGLRRWSWIAVLPPLLLYALLAGGGDSIWRATIAGVCVAFALSCGRDVDGLSLWSLALLMLFALDPMQLQSIGFQLSFGATWGLLVLAPKLKRVLERRFARGVLVELAALSLAAQMATTPILLYHFGRISLVALGTNLVAVPLAGVLVSTGMLSLVFPIGALNLFMVRLLDSMATIAANVPGAQTETPPLRLAWTIFLYGALLLAFALPHDVRGDMATLLHIARAKLASRFHKWRPQSFAAAVVLMFCIFAAWRVFAPRDNRVRITLLDVGQGESIVIRAPSGRTVLIDGGTSGNESRGEVGRGVIVPYLQAMGVQKLDAMILTHADADHCSALPQVIREVPVALAIDGAAAHAQANAQTSSTRSALPPEYSEVLAAWQQNKVPVQSAQAGQKLDLGDGAVLTVLWPRAPLDRQSSDNNAGAVLRLDYGATSMLFTADIERETEAQLVRSGTNLKCTVLKVAHHGSKTSSTRAFLQSANPSAAIISCGRYNRFGHPAPTTMNELARDKIPTFRTDIDGAIEVACDTKECEVETFR